MAVLYDEAADVTDDPAEVADLVESPPPASGRRQRRNLRRVQPEPETISEDDQPDWGSEDTPRKRRGRPPNRVSAKVKADIRAKTALMMIFPVSVWQLRDPICGSAARECIPGVSDALTEILCDSDEVVAWFQSSGGYLKYLNLLKELQPVAMVVFQHHVTHSVGQDSEEPGPDRSGWDEMYRADV